MHVLFVTSEVGPFSGRSTTAEVCSALPKGLRALGHSVTVLSPFYRGIEPAAHSLARRLSKIEVEVAGEKAACEVYTGRTVAGVDLIFLGHDELVREVEDLAVGDDLDLVARRHALFARAAARVVLEGKTRFDVVQGHDLVGALTLAHLAQSESALPRVLCLHRGASHLPRFGPEHGAVLGIDGPTLDVGVRAAARTIVASESFAASLRTRFPAADVVGVPNGTDASVWNPLTDPHLAARFDPVDLSGKARCKESTQRALDLPVRADAPLLFVAKDDTGGGTLAGFEAVASEILRNDVQLVVELGDAHDALCASLESLQERFPDRIQVRRAFDEGTRHQLLAAADLALAAPDEAPTGDAVMRMHRYGAVPVVRRVGALGDLVIDCDAKLATGTGFVFEGNDPDDLLGGVRRGLAAFPREAFGELRSRAMRVDHSWDRSARLYERAYESLFATE